MSKLGDVVQSINIVNYAKGSDYIGDLAKQLADGEDIKNLRAKIWQKLKASTELTSAQKKEIAKLSDEAFSALVQYAHVKKTALSNLSEMPAMISGIEANNPPLQNILMTGIDRDNIRNFNTSMDATLEKVDDLSLDSLRMAASPLLTPIMRVSAILHDTFSGKHKDHSKTSNPLLAVANFGLLKQPKASAGEVPKEYSQEVESCSGAIHKLATATEEVGRKATRAMADLKLITYAHEAFKSSGGKASIDQVISATLENMKKDLQTKGEQTGIAASRDEVTKLAKHVNTMLRSGLYAQLWAEHKQQEAADKTLTDRAKDWVGKMTHRARVAESSDKKALFNS